MLWTDNNTIGGIDPSEGIQLKEIDRQGIIFLMIFHQWRICMLQFKISHGWCYKKRRCWFSRGHSQIWGITSLLNCSICCCSYTNYKYIKFHAQFSIVLDCLPTWRNILWYWLCETKTISKNSSKKFCLLWQQWGVHFQWSVWNASSIKFSQVCPGHSET